MPSLNSHPSISRPVIPAPAKRFLTWVGLAVCATLCLATSGFLAPASAQTKAPIRLVAYGDSLSAGYMLPGEEAFPAVLQKALRDKGYKDIVVVNAGVSGDTSADGLARLDWTLGDGADAVILELGANDMLRGLQPAATEKRLAQIIEKMQAKHIKILLAGMRASPSLGKDYGAGFDTIYPALAKRYDIPLYPFFLDGMVEDRSQKLGDGMHPNKKGVETIVAHILPSVEALLKTIPPRS